VSDRTAPGRELLEAIAVRDFGQIAGCFTGEAVVRVLTPGPVRQLKGAARAANRYRRWLATLDQFELIEGEVVEIADRIRIRYLFRGRDPEKGWQLNEHTGYAEIENGRIGAMVLTCTGFRPTSPP
jgi:hypothetical protein